MKKLFFTLISFLHFAILPLESGAETQAGLQHILFMGDSLTAGYGIDPKNAYPTLIEKKLKSKKLPFGVISAGLSGDTTAGGVRRIDWLIRQPIDILVLALGANDGLRGLSVEESKQNLQLIVDKTREKNPNVKVIIAGMKIPPNLGYKYAKRFEDIFTELAEENKTTLVPFLLDGVAGEPHLNLPDGIHPTEEGHKILAENVWRVLEPLLENKSP